MSELDISEEFLAECQTMPKSQRHNGQYTKQEIQKRRNEVYRYHFEYGYSARKIAELIKINRNTINGDIKHWYSKVTKANDIQPESAIFTILERLDIQRTKIRESLDQATNISEKIPMERMIMDIDSKIAQINEKLYFSSTKLIGYMIESLNNHLKSKNDNTRYLGIHDKIAVSDDANT